MGTLISASPIDLYANLPDLPKAVYIAGPMRGLPQENFPAFHEAADRWRKAGWDVLNPAEADGGLQLSQTPDRTIHDCLCRDYIAVCRSKAIALLPKWWRSTGTVSEVFVALNAGKKIYDAITMEEMDRSEIAKIAFDRIALVDNVGTKRRGQDNTLASVGLDPSMLAEKVAQAEAAQPKSDIQELLEKALTTPGYQKAATWLIDQITKQRENKKQQEHEIVEKIVKRLREDNITLDNVSQNLLDSIAKIAHLEKTEPDDGCISVGGLLHTMGMLETGPDGKPHIRIKLKEVGDQLEACKPNAGKDRWTPPSPAGIDHLQTQKDETIDQEAHRLVYGDRNKAYSHPRDDYMKTAKMWTGLLIHKLRPGVEITPKEAVLMMSLMKVAREVFKHKRDNLVDLIGYVLCADRIENDPVDENMV